MNAKFSTFYKIDFTFSLCQWTNPFSQHPRPTDDVEKEEKEEDFQKKFTRLAFIGAIAVWFGYMPNSGCANVIIKSPVIIAVCNHHLEFIAFSINPIVHSIDFLWFDLMPADNIRLSLLAFCSIHTQEHKANLKWIIMIYVLCFDDKDDRFLNAFYEASP